MERTRIKRILTGGELENRFRAAGWVRTRRDSKGGFSFVDLNDGSCLGNLQVIVDWKTSGLREAIGDIHTGCSVIIEGTLKASLGKGQRVELHADFLEVVGRADPEEYPLQKKRHSLEFLRTIAHLRPRTNTFGAVARVRNAISCAIHAFFQERGFTLLHSPIISGSDCEGAGEMFRVTTLDLENLPLKAGRVDYSGDFFGGAANLTVSGQLEAEIYALALGDVYTFGPTFRAENSNTSRHLAEFWMVEPEMAFCDLQRNMEIAEAFLKYIFAYVLDHCEEDMAFFNRFIDDSVVESLRRLADQKFEPLSYTEAVSILAEEKDSFEFSVGWGADLQSEHERHLCEKVFKRPVILYDYPKDIKAFYMKVNEDGKTVRAMDVLVPRIGEIIGGSQREDDYETLHRRMLETGLNPDDYWWYLELRKFGTAPHSGFGLGFERLMQFITGLTNIRDVIPFPRTPGNAAF